MTKPNQTSTPIEQLNSVKPKEDVKAEASEVKPKEDVISRKELDDIDQLAREIFIEQCAHLNAQYDIAHHVGQAKSMARAFVLYQEPTE